MKKRVISSIIMIALIVPSIVFADPTIFGVTSTGALLGRYFFASLMFIVSIIMFHEAHTSMLGDNYERKEIKIISSLSILIVSGIIFAAVFVNPTSYTTNEFAALFIFTTVSILVTGFSFSKLGVDDRGVRYIIFISILASVFAFGYTMTTAIAGWEMIFYLVIICASVDSFGLLFGKTFGTKKIAPKISPNKTVEGFIGGVAASTLLGTIWLSLLMGNSGIFGIYTTSTHVEMFILFAFLLSLGLSFVSFFGDLIFSYFKRQREIKDYSNLIPGHGGILDRLDSHIVVNFVMIVPIFVIFA